MLTINVMNIYDPVNYYNDAKDTTVSVSINKSNAYKCTLSHIFLSEILKPSQRFIPDC